MKEQNWMSWRLSLKIKTSYCTLFFLLLILTCPGSCWEVVIPVVEDDVKDHQYHECEIVGYDSFRAGELSIMDNIKPDTKEEDPRYAVKSCLQHQ